jgi:nucleoside-diphosphate-sugar epimerase
MKNFWNKKKVLITGGAGFLGSSLSNNLLKFDCLVTVIDDLSRGEKKNLNNKIIFYKFDLKKNNLKIKNIFHKQDIVFHFASRVGSMNYYLNNEYQVMKENILIDDTVIENSINSNVKLFFYASSAHVYSTQISNKKKGRGIEEKDAFPANPPISYGLAKLIGEKKLFYAMKNKKNFKAYIGRYVGIFGPNQSLDLSNGSLIPALICKIIKHPNKYKILTNGLEERSYLYIDDAIRGTKLIIENNKKLKSNIFNICSDLSLRVNEIAKKIILVSKKKITLKVSNTKANIQKQLCSNSLIKRELGWKVEKSFMDGLRSTYIDIYKKLKKY